MQKARRGYVYTCNPGAVGDGIKGLLESASCQLAPDSERASLEEVRRQASEQTPGIRI